METSWRLRLRPRASRKLSAGPPLGWGSRGEDRLGQRENQGSLLRGGVSLSDEQKLAQGQRVGGHPRRKTKRVPSLGGKTELGLFIK